MPPPHGSDAPVEGQCDPRFAAVRDRFVQLFADGDETGAAVTFLLDGQPVVDLWGGWRDVARTAAWQSDMAHQAGVVTFPEPRPATAWADWDDLVSMLARSEPTWTPGTAHGEHVRTYGHLLGEVVRRVDGRSPADQLDIGFLNSPLWRGSEIPAVNGHGTARGIARLYAVTAQHSGVPRLLSAGLLAEATTPAMVGPDLVLDHDVAWCLGVQSEESYVGMGGLGGSDGMLDRQHGYAYGFVTRRLLDHDRAIALTDAFEACL
jgi:hypothetical protein